jgi:hypothetical protein
MNSSLRRCRPPSKSACLEVDLKLCGRAGPVGSGGFPVRRLVSPVPTRPRCDKKTRFPSGNLETSALELFTEFLETIQCFVNSLATTPARHQSGGAKQGNSWPPSGEAMQRWRTLALFGIAERECFVPLPQFRESRLEPAEVVRRCRASGLGDTLRKLPAVFQHGIQDLFFSRFHGVQAFSRGVTRLFRRLPFCLRRRT